MIDSKTPKALILFAILALAAAAALAGCGGGGSSTSGSTVEESTAPAAEQETGTEEEPAETEEGGGGEAAAGGEGKTIFTSNCASCHTLKAAGASGQVGPNLDELEPDMATVEKQVTGGGGGMPAFGSILSPAEIKEVAAFVSSEAGK